MTIIVIIAKKLQDSPHPIAKFNQHVLLSRLFPEYQPKGRFPVDTNILIDSDVINDDDDDGTTDLPTDERLPNNHSITNDAADIQPGLNLTTACSGEKRQVLRSEIPDQQPKVGFPVDTNILIDSDVIHDDDDDGTTGLPTDKRLPNNQSIRNDTSPIQPDLNLTTAGGEERRRGLGSENGASNLEANGDWTVSNSEGSIELEVRYR